MKELLSRLLGGLPSLGGSRKVATPSAAKPVTPGGIRVTSGVKEVVVDKPARSAGGAVVPAQTRAVDVAGAAGADQTKSILEAIASYEGRVVSATSEQFALSPKVQRFVAALDNGWVLFGKGHEVNPDVREAIQVLTMKNYQRVRTLPVDLEVIRSVYASHQRRFGGRVAVSPTDMQEYLFRILSEAFAAGATDVRIKGLGEDGSIWMRRLGSYEQMRGGDIPASTALQLIRTAFNNAAVSDANYEELRSQSAQVTNATFKMPQGVSGLRLEFAPLPLQGRLLAIRILPDTVATEVDIDDFGYAPIHVAQIKRMRRNPAGMILISGPTGHGKSTTLKACLEAVYRMHGGRKNILTAEDPTEYTIRNVSQIPVWKAKTTIERVEAFADTIRSVLRLDPDIVMIGEVRDSASAGLAFKAAMSGHQVWSSIHTIDAISIPARLRDEGVERYKLANPANLTGLIAQRLVRGVCPSCSIPLSEAKDEESRHQYQIMCEKVGDGLACLARTGRPGGCVACNGEGYVRRSAIAETILTDQKFMDFVNADDIAGAKRYWLEDLGGFTMKEHGLAKVLCGIICPRDVEHEIGPLDLVDAARVTKIVEFARSINADYVDRNRKDVVALIAGEAA